MTIGDRTGKIATKIATNFCQMWQFGCQMWQFGAKEKPRKPLKTLDFLGFAGPFG